MAYGQLETRWRHGRCRGGPFSAFSQIEANENRNNTALAFRTVRASVSHVAVIHTSDEARVTESLSANPLTLGFSSTPPWRVTRATKMPD